MNLFTKFKIGDKVKITNNGKCYTTYRAWVVENAPRYLPRYTMGKNVKNGTKGRVISVYEHGYFENVILCCVKTWCGGIFLIEETGLEDD